MSKKVSRFSITKLKGESKISRENANKIVVAACVQFDIDIDADYEIDEKTGKRNEAMLLNIEDYLMRGIIEIDTGSWNITHHLQGNYSESLKEIVYKPVSGDIATAMDGVDVNDRYKMMWSLLGASSGQGSAVIGKLQGVDRKVAQVVADFFI